MTNPGILTYAISGNRRRIGLLWLLGASLLALSLVTPTQVGRLTNLFSQGHEASWTDVNRAVLLLVVAQLGVSVVGYWKRRLEIVLNGSIIRALTLGVFARILRFPPAFFRDREVEKINTRAIEDSGKVADFSLEAVVDIPLAAVSLIVFGTIMIRSNWFLGACMIPLSLLSGYFIFFDRRIQSLNKTIGATWEAIRAETAQTIAGAADIRTNGAFEYAMAGMTRTMGKYGPVAAQMAKLNAVFQAIDPVLAVVRSGLLYWLGAGLCMAGSKLAGLGGQLTWGQVVTFMLLAGLFERPTSRIASFILRWRLAQESIRRWKEYMEIPVVFAPAPTAAQAPSGGGPLKFQGISVVAASGARILDGIDLEIPAGEHVAFAGPAGSGKSTLLHLASRSAEHSGGHLLLSGKSLDEYDFSSLVRAVGVVPQKAVVFNSTMRSNILLSLRRPSSRFLEDAEGQIDISNFTEVKTQRDLDQNLIRVVREVGLEKDVFKRCLDNPLPGGRATSPIRTNIESLREEIRRRLEKEGPQLMLPFGRASIVFGSLAENLLGPGPAPEDGYSAASSRVFESLEGTGLLTDLLQYGWFRLKSEQSLAAKALQRAPQLRDYLHSGPALERLDLGSSTRPSAEVVSRLSRALQELVLSSALASDVFPFLEALSGKEGSAKLVESRQRVFKGPQVWPACWATTAPSGYLEFLSLRENLLWGRTNTVLHGAAEKVDSTLWGVLAERGLVDEAILIGLESRTGEGGKYLSEGQKQKVALARALLKNPSILLMDEATASLDEASQARITELIGASFSGKTVISISHRLSTIREFDRVVVLDRGQLVQQGPYETLLAQEGIFRTLADHDARGGRSTAQRTAETPAESEKTAPEAISFPVSDVQRRLALCPLYAHLKSDQLAFLERISRRIECPKGHVLFRRGDRGDELFMILKGEVDFFLEREEDGSTEVIHSYGPGKAFGELALFGGGLRTAGARAKADVVLCAIRREDLLKLIAADPQIGIGLLQGLSQRMAEITDKDIRTLRSKAT